MARRFAVRAGLLAAAFSLLGACSMFEGTSVACPTVGVLDYSGNMTRFRSGGQRDLTDVELQAHVGSLAAECSFDNDTRTGTVDLDIVFRGQRGPASSAAEDNFGYFVAVVDPDGEVAARTAFSVQVDFDGGRTEATQEETLVLDVPIGENRSFAAYRVYVGMQLTKEQFDRNLGGGR